MACRVISALTLPLSPIGPEPAQVVAGEPVASLALVPTDDDLEVGVWEHSVGSSTDLEVDEVFVVVSGRATVTVDGGPVLELGVGDIGVLEAGARTTWVVHETLRKVYVVQE